jgi:hypothetical protein
VQDNGGTQLEPWPWQLRLAEVWEEHRRVVILKARQLGISWMAAAFSLHTAMTRPGSPVLLVSQTGDDAELLLGKARYIFEHLPPYLQPEVGRNNTVRLEFPCLASEVVALTSTERAGRGRTASLVIADEHAFHQWAEQNFAALGPTMDAGGRFIALSTADGIGNFFAELWAKAAHPKSSWHRVFLPYSMRPERDEAWYEQKLADYVRPWQIHQEYPRDPDEAFVQTGRPVFDKAYLDKHRLLCREPLPPEQWPRELTAGLYWVGVESDRPHWAKHLRFDPEELRVFAAPVKGHRYIAGADVAEGLEHGDYSDLVVLDADAPERPTEVLRLHGHWPPDVFGTLIDRVARVYPGLYGIERNNHGLTVVVTCRNLGTPGLFRERPVLSAQGVEIEPGKLGWLTSVSTKPLLIDELEHGLRTFALALSDAMAIPELVFYQNLPDGKTGAPQGQWDDRVMSTGIAWQMRKHLAQRLEAPAFPVVNVPIAPSMRQVL